jgi:hypothetical protein
VRSVGEPSWARLAEGHRDSCFPAVKILKVRSLNSITSSVEFRGKSVAVRTRGEYTFNRRLVAVSSNGSRAMPARPRPRLARDS